MPGCVNTIIMNLSLAVIAASLSFTTANSVRGSQASMFASTAEHPADTRIIGGSEARSNRYPYAVSLHDSLGHFCGGSLVASDMILTAAHCQTRSYDVAIGRHNLNSNSGESIPIKRQTPHPKYVEETSDADYMLVLLDSPAKHGSIVRLNSNKNIPSVGDDVTVMGWGDMTSDDYTREFPEVLMSVGVKAISTDDCDASSGIIYGVVDSYKGKITDYMICAADKEQDACQGDSGGPLVIHGKSSDGSDDVQIGIVSWGYGCASPDFPGVYSRVSEVYDWIVTEVCEQSSDPPTELCGGFSAGINGDDNYTPPSTLHSGDDFDDEYNDDDDTSGNDKGDGDSTPPPSPFATASGDFSYDDNASIIDVHELPAQDTNNLKWATIIEDDFKSDFGFFNSGGSHAKWMSEQKNRYGVLNIQNGKDETSSVYSNKIVDTSYSVFRVLFSTYLLHMEDDDKFCLDISADGGSDWVEEKCWSTSDLSSKIWHDGVIAEFEADNASALMVRFRCQGNHNKDDVFIDKVAIQGLQ